MAGPKQARAGTSTSREPRPPPMTFKTYKWPSKLGEDITKYGLLKKFFTTTDEFFLNLSNQRLTSEMSSLFERWGVEGGYIGTKGYHNLSILVREKVDDTKGLIQHALDWSDEHGKRYFLAQAANVPAPWQSYIQMKRITNSTNICAVYEILAASSSDFNEELKEKKLEYLAFRKDGFAGSCNANKRIGSFLVENSTVLKELIGSTRHPNSEILVDSNGFVAVGSALFYPTSTNNVAVDDEDKLWLLALEFASTEIKNDNRTRLDYELRRKDGVKNLFGGNMMAGGTSPTDLRGYAKTGGDRDYVPGQAEPEEDEEGAEEDEYEKESSDWRRHQIEYFLSLAKDGQLPIVYRCNAKLATIDFDGDPVRQAPIQGTTPNQTVFPFNVRRDRKLGELAYGRMGWKAAGFALEFKIGKGEIKRYGFYVDPESHGKENEFIRDAAEASLKDFHQRVTNMYYE